MGEGKFKKRIKETIQATCNICHTEYDTLATFEEHWKKTHMTNYGAAYPTIKDSTIYKRDVEQWVEEAKKEFLQWFDSNKLPEELDDLGDYMADNCEEIKEWFEKWFGSGEGDEK